MSSTTKLISDPSENTGPALMGIAVLFTSLAIITVAMRIWVRATMVGKVGWDVSKRCYGPHIHIVADEMETGLGHLSDSFNIHRGNGRS